MSDKITIIRATKDADNPYVIMRRGVPQDRALTWEARGMLSYILSQPDDWKVIPKDLQQNCGSAKVYKVLNELIKAGYIKRTAERNENQQFTSWIYEVYEVPQLPEPVNESEPLLTLPEMAKPHVAKRDTYKVTSLPSNDSTKEKTLAPPENGAVSGDVETPGNGEKPPRKRTMRDDLFDIIAARAFNITPENGQELNGGRVGKVLNALRKLEPELTPERLTAFYDWYARVVGVSPPRDPEKYKDRWLEFKSAATLPAPEPEFTRGMKWIGE